MCQPFPVIYSRRLIQYYMVLIQSSKLCYFEPQRMSMIKNAEELKVEQFHFNGIYIEKLLFLTAQLLITFLMPFTS